MDDKTGTDWEIVERDYRAGFVYCVFIEVNGERVYKVGKSVDFRGRLSSHQTSSPFELFVAACYYVPNMNTEERDLHDLFDSKRVRGEWFRLDREDLAIVGGRAVLA